MVFGKHKLFLAFVCLAVIVGLTDYMVYESDTMPVEFKPYEPLTGNQSLVLGSSEQIRNMTMNLSAYGNNEELTFWAGGLFGPQYAYSENGLVKVPYINLSAYHGATVDAYHLEVLLCGENLSSYWTGITFLISDYSFSSNIPAIFSPLYQAQFDVYSAPNDLYLWTDYLVGNGPPSGTYQFWVNFTLIPVAVSGPFHFNGNPYPVTITWNGTFLE